MSSQKKSKLTKKHAIAGAIILALAILVVVGIMVGKDGEAGEAVEAVVAAPEVSAFRHPLTGLETLDPFETLPRVYAVMIDNSVDAWPVSGVDRAFLVIEAPVEAAIPRFEAFFSEDAEVEKIGPVRSARPYFVDWADEFDALYAHVGGSNAALDLIASSGTFDLNEYSYGDFFWRASNRFAPHNVYTSSELLAEALASAEERGRAPEVLYGIWRFRGGQGGQDGDDQSVSVKFNSDLYTVDWDYDAATNTYLRSQGGREAKTADGTRMSANNVAVIVTDIEVLDYVGRRSVQTTGEGKAWVLRDGKTVEAVWKKPSSSERLAFYGEDGNEMAMNAGNTWIEVVPDESDVEIK